VIPLNPASINAYQINRKSLTMKNLLKIVFVYVGGFVKLSAHEWPIFDCYSNMPLVVYRIRDFIEAGFLSVYFSWDDVHRTTFYVM
jgi:hypothetical protein